MQTSIIQYKLAVSFNLNEQMVLVLCCCLLCCGRILRTARQQDQCLLGWHSDCQNDPQELCNIQGLELAGQFLCCIFMLPFLCIQEVVSQFLEELILHVNFLKVHAHAYTCAHAPAHAYAYADTISLLITPIPKYKHMHILRHTCIVLCRYIQTGVPQALSIFKATPS